MAGKKKKFKFTIDTVISRGASVVIIGAMFKILHLPGGSIIIGLGLAVEAFLFFLMGFVAQHKEPAWHEVYQELAEDDDGEPATPAVQAAAPASTAALDQMLADAKIGPEVIESLGAGLRTFGDKVAAISNVADSSAATLEFTDKIKTAS